MIASIGKLAAIYVAQHAGEPLTSLDRARLAAGRGIDGDRYFSGVGSFSRWAGSGRDITLIEQEVIDAVRRERGVDLSAGQHRRNLVTAGIRLAELNGQFFRIGGALLHGAQECAPCKYLERLVPGSFQSLIARGGLRAEIIEEGIIRIDEPIRRGRLDPVENQ